MKKFIYILSILTAILLFDSCTKEEVISCEEHQDPFALEYFDDDSRTLGSIVTGDDGGGVADTDDEADEDDDVIGDPDNDDDEMDEDDDEQLDDREGEGDEEGV
ncbi:MAG: hypothetical protein P8I55_13695 [Crocinitomix sp.]|nr:hypothetical protein [Crocinitomix sp.]